MTLLGWSVIYEDADMSGYKSNQGEDLWFTKSQKPDLSDYDNRGMNHLGIKVEKMTDVDDVVAFLKKKKIKTLFETPRHRPEFAENKDSTYYQVMFATADNLLLEVVYIGLKA